jgi:endogenous inhibitor of DNA gyrase (YacG/DUF329 family)
VRFTCPTCKRVLDEGTLGTLNSVPTLPFCSPRCRSADLGSWLAESYRIGSPASEEDLDAGLPDGASSTVPPDES